MIFPSLANRPKVRRRLPSWNHYGEFHDKLNIQSTSRHQDQTVCGIGIHATYPLIASSRLRSPALGPGLSGRGMELA